MAKNRKTGSAGPDKDNQPEGKLDDDVDALFTLPLSDFTAARNALATRLKRAGRGDDADRVKAFEKPSISAWAVNQLYWKHRQAFDRLTEAGERFREAQSAQLEGKVTDMKGPRDERRESLADLARLSAGLLRDAGHNASPEAMRRIATTLEAMSAYASVPNAPVPGRLTSDVDPPGFDALAALIHDRDTPDPAKKPASVIPFNKASLADAELSLKNARARAQTADIALKKAATDLKEAEKQRGEAEELLRLATAACDEAGQRVRVSSAEADEASKAVETAQRRVQSLLNST